MIPNVGATPEPAGAAPIVQWRTRRGRRCRLGIAGQCLGIYPGTTNVVLEACGGASQSWEFVSQSSGTSYRIRNEHANACMRRVPDPRAGLRLQVATCENVDAQRWVFHP